MSQKINPDSLHLGGDTPGFYAEYVPIPKEEQPPSCILPGGVVLNLTPAPLLPLNEACAFQFPGVIPLPPVYNPPQIKFLACEVFTADVNISTCHATRNTKLALTASGPVPPGDKDGAAECGLSLTGNICVEACEEFTTTSTVNFSDSMQGSSLQLTSRSIPDCGVDLFANFVVNACADFTATGGVSVTGSAGVVNVIKPIRVVPAGQPDCGLTLEGSIDIKACRDFAVNGGIAFTGKGVSGGVSITPTKAPDCGLNISGEVVIDACTDITASGVINVRSTDSFAAAGYIRLLPSSDGCGVSLDGDIGINACSSVKAVGTIDVTAIRGGASGTIWIEPNSDFCGINLSGSLDVSACGTISASAAPSESLSIDLTSGGKTVGTLQLNPWMTTGIANDGCEITIQHGITSPNTSIEIGGGGIDSVTSSTSTSTGCCYTEEDALRLEYDENTKNLTLAGNIPLPSFTCDPGSCAGSGAVFSDIELNSLAVGTISANSCCGGNSTIDLCSSTISLYADGSAVIAPNSIELSSGASSASMSGDSISVSGSGGSATLDTGNIRVDANGSTVDIYPPGVNMSPVAITVCVNGESRTMYVIGSAPF